MPLKISDFSVAASQGDDHIIELTSQTEVKSSGFFGRVFKSAGKDPDTNQATLQAFLNSIKQEKGQLFSNIAKARLSELTDGGKPLTGRMIKAVTQELEKAQHEVKKANEQFFQRLIYDQGPNGLKALVSAYLPQGVELTPNDLGLIAAQVQFQVQHLTSLGENITLADVKNAVFSFRSDLESLTPAGMTQLNNLVANHAQYGLSRQQAEDLRVIFLSHGVSSQQMIDKTMQFMTVAKNILPKLEACTSGPELMAVLETLNQTYQRLFGPQEQLDGPHPPEHAIPAAMHGALMLSGYTPDQTMNLYTRVLKGVPGTEVSCTCVTILTDDDSPATTRLLKPLMGMRGMIDDALAVMVGAAYIPIEVEGSHTGIGESYERRDQIPTGMFRYLRAMGYAVSEEEYGLTKHNTGALWAFSAGKGVVLAEDIYRLMHSAGNESGPSNFCDVGVGAMFSVLTQLKANEPGPGPFSPQNAWRTIFNEDPPAGVTKDNLSKAIGAKIESVMRQKMGDDFADHKGPFVFILISALGVPWQRALDIGAQPGEITFADLPVPFAFTLTAPPTWELERKTISIFTGDTFRREGEPTLSIGGHEPIQLKQPVPSQQKIDEVTAGMNDTDKEAYLEKVEQLKDYNRTVASQEPRGVYNFIADTILAQVTELTGTAEENRAQRIGVLQALSQTTSGPFRFISPLAKSDPPGQALYEHSCYNTTVSKEGDLIKVRLETPPGAPMPAKLEYVVDKAGTITMTDLRIGVPSQ